MKRYRRIVFVVLLAAVTLVAAYLHLNGKPQVSCLEIKNGETNLEIPWEEMDQGAFSGQLVDGKGDLSWHEYRGVELKVLLKEVGIMLTDDDTLQVISVDHFTATFTAQEILTDGKVYVAVEADGLLIEGIDPEERGLQIIVFGDENSRRCVRYAAIIEINR